MDQRLEETLLPSQPDREQQLLLLETEIRSCTACRLCETRTHAVPGEGHQHPRIVFVGEGPGAEEDRLGRPFVGRSGRFLDGMIESIGLHRGDLFITNVVKCRPPENRDPRPDEIAACRGFLERQIELLAPQVVGTLGRFSMARWFPGERITRIHGQVREIGPGQVAMAMYHPAAALRNPLWREAFAADMQKLPGLLAQK
ncbi:MAG: uracil-DNA glycosylase [Caldilineaceae bacterium]|nr:uracil-DNA glycosylase [Caldilineaceae bacterium]